MLSRKFRFQSYQGIDWTTATWFVAIHYIRVFSSCMLLRSSMPFCSVRVALIFTLITLHSMIVVRIESKLPPVRILSAHDQGHVSMFKSNSLRFWFKSYFQVAYFEANIHSGVCHVVSNVGVFQSSKVTSLLESAHIPIAYATLISSISIN